MSGDAFFTVLRRGHPSRVAGKTHHYGGKRGIVACASYAAKRLGVKRGVPLHEARHYQPVPAGMIAFLKKARFDRQKGKRGQPIIREQTRLYGEKHRKHLGLPIFHVPRKSAGNLPTAAKTGKNED